MMMMILYWIFYAITLAGAYSAIFAVMYGNTHIMIICLCIGIASWLVQAAIAFEDNIKELVIRLKYKWKYSK